MNKEPNIRNMPGKPEIQQMPGTLVNMEDKKRVDMKKEDERRMSGHRGQDGEQPPHFGGRRGGPGGRGRGRGGGRGGFNQGQGDNMKDGQEEYNGPRGRGRDRGAYTIDQPTVSLEEAMPPSDKKFTGRCRLFVGNLPADTSEEDFTNYFKEHGEYTEVFLNASRGFGFIRMDFRKNAEAAKCKLDGTQVKGRTLRVRFATHGAALRIKYIPPHVSNELLAQAFSIFGELERAVIIVDDRGKPTGEGIIEFARKPGAQAALKRISEGVFMLGTSPRPIIVEPLEQKDEEDGYMEKFIQKGPDFNRERENTPRFAQPGSFEFEFGQKWKELFQMHEEQQRNLSREFEAAVAKLEIEQAGAVMEHQTQMLRQDLLRRQEELRRMEEHHQMELQKRLEIRQQEDERRHQEEGRRRDEMNRRRQQQEEMYQQELYAQQERAMREMRGDMRGPGETRGDRGGHDNTAPMQPPPAPPAGLGVERGGGGRPTNEQPVGNHGGEQEEHGGYNNQGNPPMRQSRFDQPPGFNQGHGGANNGNMGGRAGMGQGQGQGQEGRMERPGAGQQQRGMNQDEYYDAKRPRRY